MTYEPKHLTDKSSYTVLTLAQILMVAAEKDFHPSEETFDEALVDVAGLKQQVAAQTLAVEHLHIALQQTVVIHECVGHK